MVRLMKLVWLLRGFLILAKAISGKLVKVFLVWLKDCKKHMEMNVMYSGLPILDLPTKYLIGGVCLFLVGLGLISWLQLKQEMDMKMPMRLGQRAPWLRKKEEDRFLRIRKAFFYTGYVEKSDRKTIKHNHPLLFEYNKGKLYSGNLTHNDQYPKVESVGLDLEGEQSFITELDKEIINGKIVGAIERSTPFNGSSTPEKFEQGVERQLRKQGLKSYGKETKEQFLKRVREENGNERED